jgi:hypothetical protein
MEYVALPFHRLVHGSRRRPQAFETLDRRVSTHRIGEMCVYYIILRLFLFMNPTRYLQLKTRPATIFSRLRSREFHSHTKVQVCGSGFTVIFALSLAVLFSFVPVHCACGP